ncbi:helix-turn-helix domain-containing protein [Actinomycetes bacterium NPDC127524]
MKESDIMQIGSLIKYYRTKEGLTQSELSEGICSIPHLSKIENNSKEANAETLALLLQKLGKNVKDIEKNEQEIKQILDQLIENIHFYQTENAQADYATLQDKLELIPHTDYLYLYELYKFRYCLFTYQIQESEEQKKWLQKHKKNFSQHETYLYNCYSAIYLILKRKLSEADSLLMSLIHNQHGELFLSAEVYYHLAMVKGYLNQPGQAIFYARKALQLYTNHFNLRRMLHTHMILGINYTQSDIYAEAMECYKHLLRNTEILGDKELVPQIYHNFADLRKKMGNQEEAITLYRKSLSLQNQQHPNYLVSVYSLAETFYSAAENELALKYFKKASALAKCINNQEYSLLSAFYLYLLHKQKDTAYVHLEEKVLPFLQAKENKQDFHYYSKMLAKYYHESGKYEPAIYYFIQSE